MHIKGSRTPRCHSQLAISPASPVSTGATLPLQGSFLHSTSGGSRMASESRRAAHLPDSQGMLLQKLGQIVLRLGRQEFERVLPFSEQHLAGPREG